jgi:branched-chain amino acid aminotransferase
MYYNENTLVYWNGSFVKAADAKIDLYAQTLHYGIGAFEGIRSYETPEGTKIFKSEEHYNRLRYSSEVMGLDFPWTNEELKKASYQLLEKNGLTNAYLRPLIYTNSNMGLTPATESFLVIQAWEWGRLYGTELSKVMTSSYQRPNPKSIFVDAKVTGHYANSILAQQEAKMKGFDEALLLDADLNVAEGSGANFFFEKDDKLYTIPKGNILPGITRNTVLELAKELEIEVIEKHFTPEEVKEADSAFFTGTAAEVAGIKSLDEYEFPLDWEDSLGRLLAKRYRRLVTRAGAHDAVLV